MPINTNVWNKIRYTLYAPVYDVIAYVLKESRKASIRELDVKKGDRVLIVGAGTGLDIPFLPMDCSIVATDITPAMVRRINQRKKKLKRDVEAMVMDGQKLGFEDNSFDKVILHLILAVIPNPVACLQEAERVLKPGGTVAIYDKFVKKDTLVSWQRKMLNRLTNVLFTDITRSMEPLVAQTNLIMVSDKEADFGGNFRWVKLRKIG